jgi:hypothetical protein
MGLTSSKGEGGGGKKICFKFLKLDSIEPLLSFRRGGNEYVGAIGLGVVVVTVDADKFLSCLSLLRVLISSRLCGSVKS